MYPKVLLVETGYSPLVHIKDSWWSDVIDYQIYDTVPSWWRRVEKFLRLDIMLALRVRQIAHQYDIVWANSEKVGIALTGIREPLVVLAHHLASRRKRLILRLAGVTRKWAGVGYLTDADREFIISYYGVACDRFIRVVARDLARFSTPESVVGGPIISLGVSKRDYGTLIGALKELPGFATEIYAGSRFDDLYHGRTFGPLPSWVQFKEPVPSDDAPALYRLARFVVVPLISTTQFSAGMNTVLESGAAGKAVIATSLPGMSSFVIDGVTGVLVPPHDRQAMKAAIHMLWTQPEMAHQMGMAGRKFIESEFNPIIVNENIKKFLTNVHARYHQP